jgi:F-type H+-transporting ATPase subunit d
VARSQHRRFAEKAVATDSVDWDAISKIVQSDQGKRELASLRNTMLELERAVGAATQSGLAEPDWAKYKKQLDADIVGAFEKAYKSMKIPEYEDKEIQNVAARFQAIVDQAEKISTESKARVSVIKKELEQIDIEKRRLLTTTIDEELANDPELAKKIDETNEKNSFLVN